MPVLKRGRRGIGKKRKKSKVHHPIQDSPARAVCLSLVLVPSEFKHVSVRINHVRRRAHKRCDFEGNFDDCSCVVHSIEPATSSNEPIPEDYDGLSADEYYVVVGCNAHKYNTDDDIDGVKEQQTTVIFENLSHEIALRECELTKINFTILKNTEHLHICQFYEQGSKVLIKLSVAIDTRLEPSIYVHGKQLPKSHAVFQNKRRIFTSDGLFNLLNSVHRYSVCHGNPEEAFVKQFGRKTTQKGYFEGNVGASYESSIRSTSCELLTDRLRCKNCQTYRVTLRTRSLRPPKERKKDFSTKPNCSMSHSELNSKAKQLQAEKRALQAKLRKEIEKNSHVLNEKESAEIETLFKDATPEVEKLWPDPHSFQRLFWEQQLKYNKLEKKCGMRWHPLIIKWALLIKSKSAKAYESMRGLGFVNLPSERTLFDYSHCTPSKTGFIPESIQMLKTECEKKGMFNVNEEWKSYVGILQDEIKIREDLVYNPTSGELIGFVDLDSTSNQIMDLQNGIAKQERDLASSALVLMVRGATTGLKFPLASFATKSLDSTQLQTVIWNAISVLEIDVEVKVLFVTCDGAAQNRKFFEMNRQSESDDSRPVNSVPNPFTDEEREIYFISDVPHLLKTARNCFGNSGSHRQSRRMWNDGKDILWTHVVGLYTEHIEPYLFTKCHKLTRQHIDLTSFSQMKVNLAAQVLSATVAQQLETEYGDRVSGTVEFIRHLNRFFDCLNTRNLYEARNERNADKGAYTDVNDERLTYLENDFLQYLRDWKESVENRPGAFTKTQRDGMQLSKQTIDGLSISIHSIVSCVRFLLQQGAPFVLTVVFNQDLLEQHFGHYRHKGGSCTNPTVADVTHTMTSLRVIGSSALASVRGNTKSFKRHSTEASFSDEKLPRRKVNRLSLH